MAAESVGRVVYLKNSPTVLRCDIMILKSRVFLQGTLTARTIIAGILSKLSTNTIIGATISDDVKVTSLNIHGFELKK